MKYTLVLVEWSDHMSTSVWHDPGELFNKPVKCTSIGWEFKNDDCAITLISTTNDEGQVGCVQTIMKSCVTKYQVLRKGDSEKVRTKVAPSRKPVPSPTGGAAKGEGEG